MAEIIPMHIPFIDFEMAVDEIEFIVPRYLEALEALEAVETLEDIPACLQNVVIYWDRLELLFEQVNALEEHVDIRSLQSNSLQSELQTLERVYLMVNQRISFFPNNWTDAMWRAADEVLKRMDRILEKMGFEADHQDRILLREVMQDNYRKKYEN